jgi:hypothetical protein
MGKLRFYTCGKYGLSDVTSKALVSGSGTGYNKLVSQNWTDVSGSAHTALRPWNSTTIFGGSYYATTETEQTFNESNYTYTEVSGVTLTALYSGDTVNVSDGKVYRTASIKLQNTGETSVNVPSITCKCSFYYNASYNADALSWCYIFDTPITLNAGETKTVVFNFGYKLPTNND